MFLRKIKRSVFLKVKIVAIDFEVREVKPTVTRLKLPKEVKELERCTCTKLSVLNKYHKY